jgi:sugar lactone lactonase YvrE
MTLRIECVVDAGCTLGESPVWDDRARQLWWVDIKRPALHRLDPSTGESRTWPLPRRTGALALRDPGGLVLAMKGGFATFDPETGVVGPLQDPEPELPGNRLNDGACDLAGRFWAGTMDDAETRPSGHLYRLDSDFRITRFEAGFVVTNGPAFSADGRTLYFADSPGRRIWAYDVDVGAGVPTARRLFAELGPADGHPDGMCVDADDHLWSAHWGAVRLSRYRPDGTVERAIELPAPLVTKPCFGGPALDDLYVTTARIGLGAAALAEAPQSGGLFRIRGLGISGLPTARFAG